MPTAGPAPALHGILVWQFLLNCQRLHESEEATLASYLHLGFVPFCESANEL